MIGQAFSDALHGRAPGVVGGAGAAPPRLAAVVLALGGGVLVLATIAMACALLGRPVDLSVMRAGAYGLEIASLTLAIGWIGVVPRSPRAVAPLLGSVGLLAAISYITTNPIRTIPAPDTNAIVIALGFVGFALGNAFGPGGRAGRVAGALALIPASCSLVTTVQGVHLSRTIDRLLAISMLGGLAAVGIALVVAIDATGARRGAQRRDWS